MVHQSHRLEPWPRLLPRGRRQSAQAARQHGSAAEHHFVTGAAQCVGARLGAAAAHQDAGWPRPAAGWGHAHMYGLCPHAVLSRDSQNPSRGAFLRGGTFMLKLWAAPRRFEEALSPLQVALRAAAAVGRRQRRRVVPAVWSRWHTSRTTPGARDSTTRAARAMRRQPAFSGWPAQPRVSCSMDLRGCLTTPQDVSTDGDEQRSHCIARPSHAVAALLTAHAD